MSKKHNDNKSEIESKLSHVNAKLADVMELLQHSTATLKLSHAIVIKLQSTIEDIYLLLDSETIHESDMEDR